MKSEKSPTGPSSSSEKTKSVKKSSPKKIIGRNDKGDFPELKLEDIDLKIDTGAYTSAIHCHQIEQFHEEGEHFIEFSLLDPSHPQYATKKIRTKNFKQKKIRSSNGVMEKRFVIKTTITIFKKTYTINLSLSKRGKMRFPILIGRKFLVGKFMVDPSQTNLSYKNKSQQL